MHDSLLPWTDIAVDAIGGAWVNASIGMTSVKSTILLNREPSNIEGIPKRDMLSCIINMNNNKHNNATTYII